MLLTALDYTTAIQVYGYLTKNLNTKVVLGIPSLAGCHITDRRHSAVVVMGLLGPLALGNAHAQVVRRIADGSLRLRMLVEHGVWCVGV